VDKIERKNQFKNQSQTKQKAIKRMRIKIES
jgi:hypothetical protein